jgi:hypothetical protein
MSIVKPRDQLSAFPWVCEDQQIVAKGMTLRDYFAAQALAGGLEQGVEDDMNINYWHDPHKLAKRAYAIADAMLEARNAS